MPLVRPNALPLVLLLLLLPVTVPLTGCASAPPPPAPPPAPVAVTPAPPAPPPPPSEPEGLAVVTAPAKLCELTRPLAQGPVELSVLPKVDVFGKVGTGALAVSFGESGAFAEVRAGGWTLRGVPAEPATRLSAAKWIAFGGVLYASKRDRFAVAGMRNGKLVLAAPAVAGFTPAESAATRETACDEVSLLVDPDGTLGRDVPPAFVASKEAKTMVLHRSQPVALAADVDGPPGGTIDADETDVKVTLLERKGKRARVRMGHLAGWVDGALVVPPAPVRPTPRATPRPLPRGFAEAAQFGVIGLLSARGGDESSGGEAPPPESGAPKSAETPTPAAGSLLACASDVRLVVDWTSTGSIAAAAGATPAAHRYVVGVIPAGKPVRVVDRGPELTTVSLGDAAFLPRGFARLTVPSRDIAAGCAPASPEPAPTAAAPPTAAADPRDAVDRLALSPANGPTDTSAMTGAMFGDTIGDSFGAGGLGLSGAGEGGTGGTIGLGTIGTIGGGGTSFGGGSKLSPSLREGTVQVNGRLPPEVIRRIVRQNFGRFRLCYESGLRSDPRLAGRVTTKFAIDRAGAVSMTTNDGSDLPSPSTVSCVVRAFGNLTFPQPEGGIVSVVYPISFSPR
jgi:hypothetical protein